MKKAEASTKARPASEDTKEDPKTAQVGQDSKSEQTMLRALLKHPLVGSKLDDLTQVALRCAKFPRRT